MEEASTPIPCHLINDKCWSRIFSFLPFKDLIRIERVCKKWQTSSLSTRKTIKISKSESGIFEQILEKHGNSLINLKVGLDDEEDKDEEKEEEKIFELIQKYCNNLLYLQVAVDTFLVSEMDVRKYPFLKNLKSLNIDIYEDILDHEKFWEKIMNFLENADSLQDFCIDDQQQCVQISRKSKRLYINGMSIDPDLDWDKLLQLFLKVADHKTGEKLEFSVYDVAGFYLKSLKSISNELTNFDLSKMFGNCFKGNCVENMEFPNLKSLSFSDLTYINDNVLSIFVRRCPQLENISFSCGFMGDYCSKVTNNGYLHLANLKNLKLLHVEAPTITYDVLEHIAVNCKRLEKIHCMNSKNLNPEKLVIIVDSLPCLNYMWLKGFKKITKECLKSIADCVKSRENNVKLKISFDEFVKIEAVNRLMLKNKALYPDSANDYLTIRLTLDDSYKDMNYFVHYD